MIGYVALDIWTVINSQLSVDSCFANVFECTKQSDTVLILCEIETPYVFPEDEILVKYRDFHSPRQKDCGRTKA